VRHFKIILTILP